jgi:uncharacterized protein YjbI with pentapeptide repeats
MNKTELKAILEKHVKWLKGKENGYKADLAEADLTGVSLRGADLRGADLTRASLRGANLTGANLTRAYLTGADLTGVNLNRANLTWAHITKEQLLTADLSAIREHFLSILEANPNEVAALRTALVEGKIDGSAYEGANAQGEFCGCLVGTIANAKKVSHKSLNPNLDSPAERWFLAIQKGNTPVSNPISAITIDWLDERGHNQEVTQL